MDFADADLQSYGPYFGFRDHFQAPVYHTYRSATHATLPTCPAGNLQTCSGPQVACQCPRAPYRTTVCFVLSDNSPALFYINNQGHICRLLQESRALLTWAVPRLASRRAMYLKREQPGCRFHSHYKPPFGGSNYGSMNPG